MFIYPPVSSKEYQSLGYLFDYLFLVFMFEVFKSGLNNCNTVIFVKGNDGELWIKTNRQKTDTPVTTPLLPKALIILNKYKDDVSAKANDKLFPMMSNQKVNSYLKEIADLCTITKVISFHLARHTFATTVPLSNGVPIETVSKMLGHTKIATTQIYAKVLENKISSDMKTLEFKLETAG